MQPNTTMTPTELRADIPAFKEGVYLNFGAHGPSPEYVVDAADEFVRTHEYESPVGDDPYETAFQAFDRTRERVATFVGAEPDEIALTESTTAGINAIANAIDWQSGDLVVRTDLEHPAGILPWQRLEREGVEVRVVETKDGRIDPDRFAEAVADARLACFSAVTWTHGTQLPVAELVDIAHDAGALALVDAVQVPGQLPMDVAGGALTLSPPPATSGCSGCGAAASSTSTVTLPRGLEPRTVGYRSVETPSADPYEYAAGARRFEVGSANPAPHVALREAIDAIEEVGTDRIEGRIRQLANRLIAGIPADRLLSPSAPESGLVTIDVDDPAATVERLAADGIVVRELPSPNAVRASVHAVNTATDVDRLLDGLEREW